MPDFSTLDALRDSPLLLVIAIGLFALIYIAYRTPLIFEKAGDYRREGWAREEEKEKEANEEKAVFSAQIKQIVGDIKSITITLSETMVASQKQMNEAIGRYMGLTNQTEALKQDYERLIEQVKTLQGQLRAKDKIIADQEKRIAALEKRLDKQVDEAIKAKRARKKKAA